MAARIESSLVEFVRSTYRKMPRTTVAGMARRFGLDDETTRKILVGSLRGGVNLIAERIKNAEEIQAARGVIPRLEPEALTADSCEPKSRRVPMRWLLAREAKARRKSNGPSLIGGSSRKGGIASAAKRAAGHAEPPST